MRSLPRPVFATIAAILLASPVGHAGLGCGGEDLDGNCDDQDNCTLVANDNGASEAGSSCDSQEDGDMDGYGNPCDTDANNDGATGLDDVGATLAEQKIGGTNPIYDYNCDGATGLDDVGRALADQKVGTIPGPSGLACAGSIPCP